MWRLVIYLIGVIALASGLAWLADRPGSLIVNWQGREFETSVFYAVVTLALCVGLAIMAWSIARSIWRSPAIVGNLMSRRRHKRGLDAISTGMIAIGAGDGAMASRYAMQARKSLPNEPLTHLLRAQAAQLSGDRVTSRRIFEAMLASPDTEQLGLRGLFLEAEREGEAEAARQFAERALAINPKLGWPVEALFDLQVKAGDWAAALETLSTGRKHGHVDKKIADRRRAVLLTAQAQPLEDAGPDKALALAQEAHGLAADLVPAAVIAARILASRGNTPKAAKIIQQTWKLAPHPDLATVYAYARVGDSPRDRLTRVKQLTLLYPNSAEGPIAVANAAIEAKDYDEARAALETLREGRLTQRVCLLMARIEGEQHGDKGRVREWLARAVNAPRDPAWTADGVVSEQWQPKSPVTGALDAFQWRVPVEQAEQREADVIAQKLEELVALGAPSGPEIAAEARTITINPVSAPAVTKPAPAAATKPSVQAAEDAFIITEPSAAAPQTARRKDVATDATVAPARPAEIDRPATTKVTASAPIVAVAAAEEDEEPKPIPALWAATGSTSHRPVPTTARPASMPSPAAPRENAPAAPPSRALATEPPRVENEEPAAAARAQATPNGTSSRRPIATAEVKPAAAPPVKTEPRKPAAEAAVPAPGGTKRPQETAAKSAAPAAKPADKAAKAKTPAEHRIFVSPRAPDDPGPEPADADDLRSPLEPYRGP